MVHQSCMVFMIQAWTFGFLIICMLFNPIDNVLEKDS